VDYRDLGVGTSAATFFRSIGGSIGVAVFGEIFANRLAAALRGGGGHGGNLGSSAAHLTPAQLHALKASQPVLFDHFLVAFNHALHIVFLASVPFAALGLVFVLMLKEVPLRRTTGRGPGVDAADSPAMQESAESAITPRTAPEGTPAAAR
jgi:hypothetical protein